MFGIMRRSSLSWAVPLVFAALLMRVLIPAGWMPSAEKGQMITLCTGTGVEKAWLGHDGTIKDSPPENSDDDKSHSDSPCIFSGVSVANLHDLAAAEMASAIIETRQNSPRNNTTAIGRGLAAPPPPATGPPLLI
jgi:hypothetical protein